ncbi:hypothetical protein, partial [Xanthomonas fragariae]|uniref:hypothetical protein n=1 Tax=Xanthomonas fragariae TaxID=48664 RepID=UPI001F2EA952
MSNGSRKFLALWKDSLSLCSLCSIDAPEVCGSGLSPVPPFRSAVLPDPLAPCELGRGLERMGARSSAGAG